MFRGKAFMSPLVFSFFAINSESETIVLCRVREEIEHGILTGRSAKPGSLSVVRKEAPYGPNQVATFPLRL